jgi:lipopolysaccharide export LptBFGC system permease protein LptF
VDQGLVLLVIVVFLGVLLASLERNPRRRRSMNLNIAFSAAFLVVYLVLQTVGLDQVVAFVTTFALFAFALVALFAAQRVRRPT